MNPRALIIFHINTERGFRGGEVQTILLMKELERRGHRNVLIARKASPVAAKAAEHGFAVKAWSLRGEWDVLSARKLAQAIRNEKPDILHAHTPHGCALALLARGGKSEPAIIFSRRVSFPIRSRRKFKSVNGFLAVSEPVRDQLLKAGFEEERIFVAKSATDFSALDRSFSRHQARKEFHIPEDALVIGYVSQFERGKGQRELIQTLIHLPPDCLLILAGTGPDFEYCKKLAAKLAVTNRVLFTGQKENVASVYAAMDVFFFASVQGEGWSGVIRESMGLGLTTIAIRQPVLEQQIQHGHTGILVSNDPGEWVTAILRLKNDPAEREKLGLAAKTEARSHTVEAMTDSTEACYRTVLGERGLRVRT